MQMRFAGSVGRAALIAACFLALSAPAAHALEPPRSPAWPDTMTARLAALALVQTLNANLLSNVSATQTLDQWCAAHALAPPGTQVVADRVAGVDKPADAAVRETLRVGPDEPVRYRRVRLRCGERVLSEADNWYVPALLTDDMNRLLDTTDISFGRIVRPLGFRRETLGATLLWDPLPEGWETGAAVPPEDGTVLEVPPFVLEHRAVLALPDGRPFSTLVENYTREILAFPWIGAP